MSASTGRLAIVALGLVFASCSRSESEDDEVVDTSLNDPAPALEAEEEVDNLAGDVEQEPAFEERQKPSNSARSQTSRSERPYYDEEEYDPEPPSDPGPRRASAPPIERLFSGDDYPADAQRNNEQGTVTVELSIGTDGRVSSCSVAGSSGSRSLDNATCRILRSRARFSPALDESGHPTVDTYTKSITWRLEG